MELADIWDDRYFLLYLTDFAYLTTIFYPTTDQLNWSCNRRRGILFMALSHAPEVFETKLFFFVDPLLTT